MAGELKALYHNKESRRVTDPLSNDTQPSFQKANAGADNILPRRAI